MTGLGIRMLVRAMGVAAAVAVCAVAFSGSAYAAAVVTGDGTSGGSLVIQPDPSDDMHVGSMDLRYFRQIAAFEEMPVDKTVRQVTIGGLRAASGCTGGGGNVTVNLNVYESSSPSRADATLVATSTSWRGMSPTFENVSWTIPETTFHEGYGYYFELTTGLESACAKAVMTNWSHDGQINAGTATCESWWNAYAGAYFRMWHAQGVSDWSCPTTPSSFDPDIPSGWILIRNGGAIIESDPTVPWVYPQNACDPDYFYTTGNFWKAESPPWWDLNACTFTSVTAPGGTSTDGWYHSTPVIGGEPRDVGTDMYMRIDPTRFNGPSFSDLYGPAGAPGSGLSPNLPQCEKGDPINCASGNFTETQVDLSLAGTGDLALSRTYNAQAAARDGAPVGRFGYGWSDLYGQHLNIDAATGVVVVEDAAGATVPFMANGDGTFRKDPWVHATLTEDAGEYTYTLPDRSSRTFDSAGHLTALRDRNDNITTLTYDGDDLDKVEAPDGRAMSFSYNGNGTVASAESSAGREVEYTYDDGELVTVSDTRDKEWHFTYDGDHRATVIEDPRGNDVTNEYDSDDRVTAQTDRRGKETTFEYAAVGDDYAYKHKTTVTDPEGDVTETTFTNNVPTEIVSAAGSADEATKTVSYDEDLNPTLVVDGRGKHWEYGYDEFGNRTSAKDPLNRITHWTYSSQRDLLSEELPSGLETTYAHDGDGNVTSVTRHGSENQITTMDYDSDGNLIEKTDPLENSWTFAYDSDGDLTSKTSPLGHETSFTHDEDGFTLTEVSPRGHLLGADPDDFKTTYVLDGSGNPTLITDRLGHDTTIVYDNNGNTISVTDRDGHETQTTYDANDQPTELERADSSTRLTGYDDNGLVVSQTDGEENERTYARDSQGRIASVTDPSSKTFAFAYDDADNRTSVTDPSSRTTAYSYDDAGQLTGVNYSTDHPADIAFTYTADGLRSTLVQGGKTAHWNYDSLNRLSSTENAQDQLVDFDYDLADHLTSIGYPDGITPGDPQETPETVEAGTVTRTYDDDGRLTAVEDWLENETTFDYNVEDALIGITRPDGTAADRTVDRLNRLTEIDDSGTNFDFTATYTRTNEGLLASQTETGDGAGTAMTFGRDDVPRLTSSGTGNQSYQYDDADRITQMVDGATTRNQSFDAAGQLTEIKDGSDTSLATLGYDNEGSRTSVDAVSGPDTTLTYDQNLKLTEYEGPPVGGGSSMTQTYGYDGDGLRQYSEQSDVRTYETWDDSGEMPLMLQDGDTSYIYGPENLPIEQITAAADARFFHQDQLGSTRALTDESGEPVATYSYTPFGALSSAAGPASTPFRYAGQYRDATGMYYMRARYYDPSTAQFISRDPLGAETREPYGYAGGSPTDSVDPTGLLSLQEVSDSLAGFGDELTFGGTRKVRELIGSDGTNYCSDAYRRGGYAGVLSGVFVPGAGWLKGGKLTVKGIEGLSAAGRAAHAGELSRAGRSLEKHADDFGIKIVGNDAAKSRLGEQVLDDILAAPGARTVAIRSGNFKGGIRVIAPNGRGASFDASGRFQYFGKYDY